MNTIHPTMNAILRSFCEPQRAAAYVLAEDATRAVVADAIANATPAGIVQDELLRRAVLAERRADEFQNQLDSLLRTPFTVEIQTRASVTNRDPDFCSQAEVSEIQAPQQLIAQAVEWLIDRHMRELEAKVRELISVSAQPE